MNWKRIATYAVGGALVVAGTLVPGAQPLIAAGLGVVGLATSWPGDKAKIRKLQREKVALSNELGPPVA